MVISTFGDPRYDFDVEYADSGFGDESISDLESYVDWIPPVNRKRHPAGDGTFCSPPSLPIPQRDPTLLPSLAFSIPISVQSESQLSQTPTSQFTPASRTNPTIARPYEFSLPPSIPSSKPLGAYLLRRFLEDNGDNSSSGAE